MINIEKLQKESGIIGNSDEITQVVEMVGQVAPVDERDFGWGLPDL